MKYKCFLFTDMAGGVCLDQGTSMSQVSLSLLVFILTTLNSLEWEPTFMPFCPFSELFFFFAGSNLKLKVSCPSCHLVSKSSVGTLTKSGTESRSHVSEAPLQGFVELCPLTAPCNASESLCQLLRKQRRMLKDGKELPASTAHSTLTATHWKRRAVCIEIPSV